jgi:hypothetical protein
MLALGVSYGALLAAAVIMALSPGGALPVMLFVLFFLALAPAAAGWILRRKQDQPPGTRAADPGGRVRTRPGPAW